MLGIIDAIGDARDISKPIARRFTRWVRIDCTTAMAWRSPGGVRFPQEHP
jgi:hypothetical protein